MTNKNKKVGHTHAPPGKRVQVVLRDGSMFIARFKDDEGRYTSFLDHEKIRTNTIYSLRILPTGVME